MRLLPVAGTLGALAVAGLALSATTRWATARAADDGRSSVVVVELFTSEGCSSCPPADTLLIDLLRTQPVPGVFVVGLSEHVDYWNRLGWRDPFSSGHFTERQTRYDAAVFGGGRIYTPQMVVDGRIDVIGNDRAAVLRAIRGASRSQKARVTLRVGREADRTAIGVEASAPPELGRNEAADLLIAITEDGLASAVARGENSGRRLQHSAVVRTLTKAGTWRPSEASFAASTSQRLDPSWQISELRIIALLQERESRRIIGAATVAVPR